jgi:hypothetical protein
MVTEQCLYLSYTTEWLQKIKYNVYIVILYGEK